MKQSTTYEVEPIIILGSVNRWGRLAVQLMNFASWLFVISGNKKYRDSNRFEQAYKKVSELHKKGHIPKGVKGHFEYFTNEDGLKIIYNDAIDDALSVIQKYLPVNPKL